MSSNASYGIIAGASIAAAVLAGVVWHRSQKKKDSKKPQRRMSHTSSTIAIGAFPPQVNIPDPVINATLFFDTCPTVQDIVYGVVPQMLKFERFSHVPSRKDGALYPCPNLDPAKLVRRVEIDGNRDVLMQVVEGHLMDSVETGRDNLPWWEFLVIENMAQGQQSVVIWRTHHSLCDGLSMIAVVQQVFEYADGSPIDSVLPQKLIDKFSGHKRLSLPTILWKSLEASFTFLSLPVGRYDDDTVFSKGYNKDMVHTRNRQVVVFPTFPLDFIKAIKNAAKATINDVIYTCYSQAIRSYLEQENCSVLKAKGDTLRCRAFLPAALPRSGDVVEDRTQTLRNRWCFVSTDLAVGIGDIKDRLQHVHRQFLDLKNSLKVPVCLGLQNKVVGPYSPTSLNRNLVFQAMSRRSTIFSNVPGPTKPCSFANQEVAGVQMLFAGNLIPQIGFVSYRGNIFGNLVLDPEAVPNCQALSRFFGEAVIDLAEQLDVPVSQDVKELVSKDTK